jgi:hypothetical protein
MCALLFSSRKSPTALPRCIGATPPRRRMPSFQSRRAGCFRLAAGVRTTRSPRRFLQPDAGKSFASPTKPARDCTAPYAARRGENAHSSSEKDSFGRSNRRRLRVICGAITKRLCRLFFGDAGRPCERSPRPATSCINRSSTFRGGVAPAPSQPARVRAFLREEH